LRSQPPFSKEALTMADFKSLESTVNQAVQSKKIPGVVLAAGTGAGVLYEGAFGHREIGKPAPMTTDTVVWIASMTKAITAAAAMQQVERGKLSLEKPASDVLPALGAVRVLEGFDDTGKPRLRAPKRPITLRHLLTHTAGFSYEIWSPSIAKFQEVTGTPGITTCTNAALGTPLLFDPGERWDYGINIDWAGKMVEAASGQRLDRYLQEHITGPLGMKDTAFKMGDSQKARLSAMHQRNPDGSLVAIEFGLPEDPEFHMGGGGLYGTAGDYLKFCRMILGGGTLGGAQVLQKASVDTMAQNHIGPLEIEVLKTAMPPLSNDVELFPGMSKKWGLSFLINTRDVASGRAANSLAWAGLGNTYFWIDRTRGVCGVFLSQLLPFYDDIAIDLFAQFEAAVYRNV
jgi:CubicO group peptidase (beta-lactamase class C family)